MNRRGMIASLVPSTVLLGASAATPATVGPRLIKPNIGPVLAAWVAEKPDSREAHVEIRWNFGTLEVYLRDSGAEVHNFRCDEATPGSFTVADADARALIAEVASKVEAALQPEQAPVPVPLIYLEQWRKFTGDFVVARSDRCYFAARQEGDVIYSSALWSPSERSPFWVIYATEWSVGDFIASVSQERHLESDIPLHMDRWSSNATMLALQHRGVQVSSFATSPSAIAAGANFIHHKAYSDVLRHTGPKSLELGESLGSTMTVLDDFGNLIVKKPDGRAGAFLMAAAVAASQEKINEPT